MEMLATIYCRQGNWSKAEEIVRIEFEGREGAVEMLLECYFQQNRWDEARNLLEVMEDEFRAKGSRKALISKFIL